MNVIDITSELQTAKSKIRLAAYCRVSSDSADQLHSFASQIRYYKDYERKNPRYQLVDIYADEGITGTSMTKRDAFNRMIGDCKKGKIDRIIVKSVSRFSRNTRRFSLRSASQSSARLRRVNLKTSARMSAGVRIKVRKKEKYPSQNTDLCSLSTKRRAIHLDGSSLVWYFVEGNRTIQMQQSGGLLPDSGSTGSKPFQIDPPQLAQWWVRSKAHIQRSKASDTCFSNSGICSFCGQLC